MLRVQNHIVHNLEADFNGTKVKLGDICFKPLAPDNDNCAIMSPLQYFQNDEKNLDYQPNPDDWDKPCFGGGFLEQLKACVQ